MYPTRFSSSAWSCKKVGFFINTLLHFIYIVLYSIIAHKILWYNIFLQKAENDEKHAEI
jgi:hypothetical protein